jgi:CRISPR/Cas system endoribonuclease Cas6 (RAMP superfamily)
MVMEEYEKFDKSTRLLTYKILLEKFNEKYTDLSDSQKTLLKEYVYNVSNSPKLKSFVNEEINTVKSQLSHLANKVVDPVVKIKINEVTNLLQPLCKKSSVHDDNIINLLNYYELVNELDSVHGKA